MLASPNSVNTTKSIGESVLDATSPRRRQEGQPATSPPPRPDNGITCAVLPFNCAAPDDQSLADTIAEDVLAELALFQNVTVASRARGAFGASTQADYQAADDAAARLRALEPSGYAAHAIGGHVAMRQGRHAEALDSLRHAHALNPNAVWTMRWLSWEESNHGLAGPAREHAELSLRHSPRDQLVYLGHWSLALALWVGGDLAGATDHVRRAVALTPRFGGYYILLAACLAEQGKLADAAEAVARVRQNCPGLIESRPAGRSYFVVPELAQRYRAALTRAVAGPAAPPAAAALAALTERERQVLRLVAQGKSNAAVSEALGISEHTAKRHIANILLKLDLPTRSAAATLAGRHGLT